MPLSLQPNLSFVRTPSKSHAAPLFNCKLQFDSYVGACVAPIMLEELCKWIQHFIYKIRCSDLKANNVGSRFHWNFEHFDAVILWSESLLSNWNLSVFLLSFVFTIKTKVLTSISVEVSSKNGARERLKPPKTVKNPETKESSYHRNFCFRQESKEIILKTQIVLCKFLVQIVKYRNGIADLHCVQGLGIIYETVLCHDHN